MTARAAWGLRIGGVLAALIALLALKVDLPEGDDYRTPSSNVPQRNLTLFPGSELTQELVVTGGRVRWIEVELGSRKRRPAQTLHMRVAREAADGSWHLLAERPLTVRRRSDMQRVSFKPALNLRAGERIAVTLRCDEGVQHPPSWKVAPDWQADGSRLLVDGQPQQGTAQLAIGYRHRSTRLFRSLPRSFRRVSVMLGPVGRAVFAAGLLLSLVGLCALAVGAKPR